MKLSWTTCRSHPAGIAIWFALTLAFAAAAFVVLPIINAPNWVMIVFGLLVVCALLAGLAIARCRFRYNDSKIESRYFRHIKRSWTQVDGWSRFGKNGTLFIRFDDGKIIGSDGWAFGEGDVDRLEIALRDKIGNPKTGADIVCPWFLRPLIGVMSGGTAG